MGQVSELLQQEYDEEKDLLRRDRSPSPPPQYDENGRRTNLRPQRWRARLVEEKKRLIAAAATLSIKFREANATKALKGVKYEARIPFPDKEYPGYNFQGTCSCCFCFFFVVLAYIAIFCGIARDTLALCPNRISFASSHERGGGMSSLAAASSVPWVLPEL